MVKQKGPIEESSHSAQSNMPLMCRRKGTVILQIWWQILLMALYTAVIVCIHNYVDGCRMDFPLTLVSILGVVTGLLLVFRTNTAYDRFHLSPLTFIPSHFVSSQTYWEGRRLWSQMVLNIRNTTRAIWACVEERPGNSRDVVEKVSAINLLIAFAFAVKNYLREEYSYDEGDMQELISHLPRFATPSSTLALKRQRQSFSSQTKIGKHQSQTTLGSKGNVTSKSSTSINKTPKKEFNLTAYDIAAPTNIPIEISYYLASYVNSLRVRNLCDSGAISTMNSSVASLVDCLTSFERILRTPIPLAYSIHLHYSIWLYLLALPFQLVGKLDWFTIPAVTLASFALLGILSIGWEIENPFGYDDNDLPLDDFCNVIKTEAQVIMGRAVPSIDSWLMSKENHPLAPASNLNAPELTKRSIYDIRKTLARGAPIVPVELSYVSETLEPRNLDYEGIDLYDQDVTLVIRDAKF